jgi:hypothetical protein
MATEDLDDSTALVLRSLALLASTLVCGAAEDFADPAERVETEESGAGVATD